MEKLNNDVLALIISQLCATPPPPPLSLTWGFAPPRQQSQVAVYASVNKRWQVLVETHTLSHIALKSADLPAFSTIFNSSRRRTCLRRLAFTASLPTHGTSRSTFSRNLEAFRGDLGILFGILSPWDAGHGILELHLDAVWDLATPDNESIDLHFDVTRSSASRRYLTLPEHGNEQLLPLVQRITSFTTSVSAGCAIHPKAQCTLALAMPRLTHLSLSYLDPVPARLALRREHRCALAAGLLSLSRLNALTHLTITRESMSLIHNHGFSAGSLEDSNGVDALSAAIRTLAGSSQGLTDLRLEDTLVSAQLLLGDETWPTLRRLTISSACILAPSGAWYYTGDPAAVEAGVDSAPGSPSIASSDEDSESEGEEDEVLNGVRPTHEWRMNPDPLTFNPLIAALTDAVVKRMPVLESACLEVGMNMSECVGVEVRFAEAGVKMQNRPDCKEDSDEEKRARRCYCWTGRAAEWEVPGEIMAIWEEWAGEKGSVDLARWPSIS